MMLFGALTASLGPTYHIGTLMHMGPGFMPTVLGTILIMLGVVIAGSAAAAAPDGDEHVLPAHPQWFAWGCILAGPLLFIILGSLFGMAAGTFACVFVSALGDRTATRTGALVLAAVVTLFGVALFHYVLHISMPVFAWRL